MSFPFFGERLYASMSATLALVVAFLNPNPRKEQPQHKHVKTPNTYATSNQETSSNNT
jgi:hypothetical protein